MKTIILSSLSMCLLLVSCSDTEKEAPKRNVEIDSNDDNVTISREDYKLLVEGFNGLFITLEAIGNEGSDKCKEGCEARLINAKRACIRSGDSFPHLPETGSLNGDMVFRPGTTKENLRCLLNAIKDYQACLKKCKEESNEVSGEI